MGAKKIVPQNEKVKFLTITVSFLQNKFCETLRDFTIDCTHSGYVSALEVTYSFKIFKISSSFKVTYWFNQIKKIKNISMIFQDSFYR